MSWILNYDQFRSSLNESEISPSKIYSDPNDPYQYAVVDGKWWTRGPKFSTWTSLENNDKAVEILDARYPGVRTQSAATRISSKPKQLTVQPGGRFSNATEFTSQLLPLAKRVVDTLNLKVPAEAVLSHWALESDFGRSLPGPYNYAGLKASGPLKDKKGKPVLAEERYSNRQVNLLLAGKTSEEFVRVLKKTDTIRKKGRDVTVDQWYGAGSWDRARAEGKQWVQVKTHFASFSSYDDFVDGYIKVLMGNRYSKRLRFANSTETFAKSIAKGGYATADPRKYVASIVSQTAKIENLS